MGYFDLKAICSCCGEEIGLNRYKVKKSDAWICPKCINRAGGATKINVNKMTIEEIKHLIDEKEISSKKRSDSASGLSTGEEMYMYAKNNGYGSGITDNWGIKHFKVIEEHLLPNETVLMTFIGLHNYISTTKHDSHYAYAITNKRIMMAQKQMIAGEKMQTVYLDNLNDITFKSGIVMGTMAIDTIKEVFNVGLDKISAKAIFEKAHLVIDEIRNSANAPVSETTSSLVDKISPADEILKYKQLLDAGAITQEEFEIKKKQLLNL